MNSTSRGSRLVSSAARSPALAITGPDVARKSTPSSRATICASVVLPRPGGPTNSTWSSASLRARAASMKTWRLARACSWPMNSASRCGRSDTSSVVVARFGGDKTAARRAHLANSFSPSRISVAVSAPSPALRAAARDRGGRLRLAVAEIDQRRDRVGHRPRRALLVERAGSAPPPDRHREGRRLVLQFGDDALGELRPDARRARDHRLVAHRDRRRELGRLERAKHRQRHLGADPLHGLQQAEPFALEVVAKP